MKMTDLEPKILFKYFDEITKVPRPSKKEEKILQYLKDFAEKHQLEYKQDKAGNIVIKKEATKGYEHLQPICLQAHVDMVCEKNSDKQHDFDNDPITPIVDGEWLRADGTTLGADDGIGVASILAIMADDTIEHGPLEGLFTVDEETGLTGAMEIEPGMFDSKILINLDSEDEGEMFIGCAGGMGTMGYYDYKKEAAPADLCFMDVKVSGLSGGHSGGDIHRALGNANKILIRTLHEIQKETPLRIAVIEGGNLHNAIPREAHAIVGVPTAMREKTVAAVNMVMSEVSHELRLRDPNVKVEIISAETPASVIDKETSDKLISALYVMPHGVLGMSDQIEGLVESSTNLASIKMKEEGVISVETSQRSSSETQKAQIGELVKEIFLITGARIEVRDGYPGWAPNNESPILKIVVEAYEHIFGRKPAVKAIHAGLECGLFLEKYPYLDMVSFGPTLRDVHSPDERLEIKTADMYWRHLLEVLKRIPANN